MLICQINKRILKIHQSIFSIFRKLYHTPPPTATCHTHQFFLGPANKQLRVMGSTIYGTCRCTGCPKICIHFWSNSFQPFSAHGPIN